jgi:hypothetical protein
VRQRIDCVGSVCNGETDARDQDWYELHLTQDTDVTFTMTARFPFEMALMENGGDHTNCTFTTRQNIIGNTCETKLLEECLTTGDWWVRIRPGTFIGVPCNSAYRLSVTCGSCTLPHGACCDASVAGCTERADKACTPRGGIYKGDGTTCAVEGATCPGVPGNNDCADNPTYYLTSDSVKKPYDLSFATDTDLAGTPGNPDTPAGVRRWRASGTQPNIREGMSFVTSTVILTTQRNGVRRRSS